MRIQCIKTWRRELKPTASQLRTLEQWGETCRREYNLALSVQLKHRNEQRELAINRMFAFSAVGIEPPQLDRKLKNMSVNQLVSVLQQTRKNHQFRSEPPAQSMNAVIGNLDEAFQNWFHGSGFPRFKKRLSSWSIPIPSYAQTFFISDDGSLVKIAKLGNVKLKEPLPRDFNAREATIICKNGKCFISIVGRKRVTVPEIKYDNVIGVDRGIRNVAVDSQCVTIKNLRILKQSEAKIARLQRQIARQQRGSNRSKQNSVKLTKLHEKIKNVKQNNLHVGSRSIVNRADVIVLEDLNVMGMFKEGDASHGKADAAMSELGRQIRYKAEHAGKVYLNYPRFERSSQRCSKCGIDVDLPRNQSVFKCSCGFTADRDVNASLVLQSWGERKVAPRRTGAGAPSVPIKSSARSTTLRAETMGEVTDAGNGIGAPMRSANLESGEPSQEARADSGSGLYPVAEGCGIPTVMQATGKTEPSTTVATGKPLQRSCTV